MTGPVKLTRTQLLTKMRGLIDIHIKLQEDYERAVHRIQVLERQLGLDPIPSTHTRTKPHSTL